MLNVKFTAKPRIKAPVGQVIGKNAAEKSKGLFAAEDWSCSKFAFCLIIQLFL